MTTDRVQAKREMLEWINDMREANKLQREASRRDSENIERVVKMATAIFAVAVLFYVVMFALTVKKLLAREHSAVVQETCQ